MKKKFSSIWRVVIALVLIFSLGAVFSSVPTVTGANGVVEVTIIECPEGELVTPCTNFGIKAEIYNNTGDIARDVIAYIEIDGEAERVAGMPDHWDLGNMDVGQTTTVAWTLHCTDPGDVLITVTTNKGTAFDTCNVEQKEPPVLVLTVDAPCEVCTNCGPDNNFTVTADVENTGDVSAHNLTATLSKSGPGTALVTSPATQTVGDGIADPGDTETVTWNVTCTGEGGVTFTVTLTATNSETLESIGPLTETATVHQKDIIALITDVEGQGCTDTMQIIDTVSTLQLYDVTATVTNCTDQQMPIDVTLTVPPSSILAAGQTVHIVIPGVADYTVPQAETVEIANVCGCCGVEITWVLQCIASTGGSLDPLVVTARTPAGALLDVNTDCQAAGVYQEDKVHLETIMQAYVFDCEGCELTSCPISAVTVGQDFDVLISITNTGEADAENVTVDLTTTGGISDTSPDCLGTWDSLVFAGTILGNTTESVWLSDLIDVGELCFCASENTVEVTIDLIAGTDENTCEAIPGDNIGFICPLLIKQVPLEVVIINPLTCEEIPLCTTFAVKARLINSSLTQDITGVTAELSWTTDPADAVGVTLVSGSDNPATVGTIPHAVDAETPTEVEVTWMVTCEDVSDVTFHVCVEAESPDLKVQDILDMDVHGDGDDPYWPITIHQIAPEPADVTVEIVSPMGPDFELQTGGDGAAEWSTDYAYSGSWSVKLYAPGPGDHWGDYGKLILPLDMAFEDLQDFSFWVEGGESAQALPLHEIELDMTGTVDLLSAAPHHTGLGTNPSPECDRVVVSSQPGQNEGWSTTLLTDGTDGWQKYGTHDAATINVGTGEYWAVQVFKGDDISIFYYYIWADIHAALDGYATVTEVKAELRYPQDPADTASTVYVDDIIINLVTYPVEINTYVATSQDFAVTAVITNNEPSATVTIDTATLNITPSGSASATGPVPSTDWVITAGQSKTATWTVHCNDSGVTDISVAVSGTSEICQVATATSPLVTIYQYPAAHLEVQGISAVPTTVNVSENFTVSANIVNTGEADAWEVSTTLSVFPEGSARIITGGYTLPVGTLVGHDQEGSFPVSWTLHCKVACDTTITITAEGYDEYGWHLKQAWNEYEDVFVLSLESEPGRAIEERFIEDAWVTVKQLESGGLDLGIIKTVDNANPEVYEDVVYTITVTNYGPTSASGVTVTDDLGDTIVSYVSDVATQGTYDDTSGIWTIGNMVVGASASLMVTAEVQLLDEYTNEATVTCDQPDGNTLNNTDSATINPSLAINLELGWNFVSWPLIPDNPGIETSPGVLDDLLPLLDNVDSVWGNFDPEADTWADTWDTYDPASITNTLTEMWDGVGFWIDMKTAGKAITIVGQEQPDPPLTPRVYPVVGGDGGYWNVIGFKSTTAKSPDVYLAGIANKYTIIYGFDEGAYFIVGTQAKPFLEPGLAYWIAVLDSGNIFP